MLLIHAIFNIGAIIKIDPSSLDIAIKKAGRRNKLKLIKTLQFQKSISISITYLGLLGIEWSLIFMLGHAE